MFSRRFAAICVRHHQEWSFRHSSTVRGKESDSNAVDAVFFLLPPHRWVIAAGGLSSLRQLLCCSWGRGPDSKSVDVVLEVRLLLPSRWATAVVFSGVAGAVFSERALYRGAWTSTDLESGPLPQLQHGSCRNEERAPAAVTQRSSYR